MRTEKFTMERDILNVGDTVTITESRLPRAYYYTAVPALAMSGNFTAENRILSTTGKVTGKTTESGSWILDIEFEN